MKKFMSLVTMVLLFFSCTFFPQRGNPLEMYDVSAVQEDFYQFRKILENKAACLYTDKVRLKIMLDEAEAALKNEMSEEEFYRLLAPIAAELKCGHSFLSVSEAAEEYMKTSGLFFPLEVRILNNNLYVIKDPYNTGVKPGTQILSINGQKSEEVVQKILNNMTTDGNDTGRKRYDAERWFASMYYIFIDTPFVFTLELLGGLSESEMYTAEISAVHDSSLVTTTMGIVHNTANTPYLFEIKDTYALAKIPTFSCTDISTYKNDMYSFFSDIKTRKNENLILDVRGNYGGSPEPTIELFSYLIKTPAIFFADDNPFYLAKWKKPVQPSEKNFTGNLYVLMDEAGFSMNSFLLSLLKYHKIGVLIGAKSSGGFMCSDASMNAVLKNTGIRLRYSTDVFKTKVEGFPAGEGIGPDISIEWTIDDCVNGNDPVMKSVLEML